MSGAFGAFLGAVAGVSATLFFIGAGLLVVSALASGAILALYLVGRRAGFEAERARLARPTPAEVPHVVVQIPVFNEGELVKRAIASALALDWPRDRLTIQILDDSTDGSQEATARLVESRRAEGADIEHRRRSDRSDFKAGAMRDAMADSPHEFFAVFDVDYVVPADFLRRTIPCFGDDRAIAFVQARCDFLNPTANRLTRVQTALLDAHVAVEQPARYWFSLPFPFNGTCGVWRKSAIEAAGGWRGDTVAEDLDLSYRAWMNGYRGVFLTSVAAQGELPEQLDAWRIQQSRWGLGFGQVARRVAPQILADRRLSVRDKMGALFHLAPWWSALLAQATFLLGVIAALLHPSAWLAPVILVWGAVFGLGVLVTIASILLGRVAAGRPGGVAGALLTGRDVIGFGLWVVVSNVGSHLKAALGRGAAFARTPKTGSRPAE